jgi:hypothetical protein
LTTMYLQKEVWRRRRRRRTVIILHLSENVDF